MVRGWRSKRAVQCNKNKQWDELIRALGQRPTQKALREQSLERGGGERAGNRNGKAKGNQTPNEDVWLVARKVRRWVFKTPRSKANQTFLRAKPVRKTPRKGSFPSDRQRGDFQSRPEVETRWASKTIQRPSCPLHAELLCSLNRIGTPHQCPVH